MVYLVELTVRAIRDLEHIFLAINAENSHRAHAWFIGLTKSVRGLNEHPARSPAAPEDKRLRHLLFGTGRHVYRIIYGIDESKRVVTVRHIRHGARRPFRRGAV
jgi:toxin ParE1/3/4